MSIQKCTKCRINERKYHGSCRECYNESQRQRRKNNGNLSIIRYEKTKKGFIVRLYRNMKSRITGVQKGKYHLYQNKELLNKEDFYEWSLNNTIFNKLFKEWENSNYNRKLTPSVDRVNSSIGYIIHNMEWVTHSENSRRGNQEKNRRYNKLIDYTPQLLSNIIGE